MHPRDLLAIRAAFPALASKPDTYIEAWCDVLLENAIGAPAPHELAPWIATTDGGIAVRESLGTLRAWRTGAALAGGLPQHRGLA